MQVIIGGFWQHTHFFHKKIIRGNQTVKSFKRLQTLYYRTHCWETCKNNIFNMFVKFWGYSFFNGIFSRLSCFVESWGIYLKSKSTNQVIAFGHLKCVTNRKSTVNYIELIVPFLKTDKTGKGESVILEPTKNYLCAVLWPKN